MAPNTISTYSRAPGTGLRVAMPAPARRLKVTAWGLAVAALLVVAASTPTATVLALAILLLTVLAAFGALWGVMAFVDRQIRRAGAAPAHGAPRTSTAPSAQQAA
jgi:hypothetical protein